MLTSPVHNLLVDIRARWALSSSPTLDVLGASALVLRRPLLDAVDIRVCDARADDLPVVVRRFHTVDRPELEQMLDRTLTARSAEEALLRS